MDSFSHGFVFASSCLSDRPLSSKYLTQKFSVVTPKQLEIEALALPRQALVELLARLLGYLGQTEEIDQDVAAVWVEEAERRDRALDENQVVGIPVEEVFQLSVK